MTPDVVFAFMLGVVMGALGFALVALLVVERERESALPCVDTLARVTRNQRRGDAQPPFDAMSLRTTHPHQPNRGSAAKE